MILPALLLGLPLLLGPARGAFVSVDEAAALLGEGATVLDARPRGEFRAGHLPGAARIDWRDHRDGWGRTGRLSDDDAALGRDLGRLGVDAARPVLVTGAAAAGWGEEGRIAWMLTYLGHPRVHILDGGVGAWREAGRALEAGGGRAPEGRRFVVRREPSLRAELPDAIAASRATLGPVLVDVRTREEWGGARLYWEPRGGHLPGAVHLAWTDLLDEHGRLRSAGALGALLAARHVPEGRPLIVYCTGGVRSAFAWAALRTLGRDVRNFDGSFYQWAARADLPVCPGVTDLSVGNCGLPSP